MMTRQQEKVLDAVREFWTVKGYSPSVREVMHSAGVKSTSTTLMELRNLRALGLLSFEDRKNRTIVLTDGEADPCERSALDLLSRMAANGAVPERYMSEVAVLLDWEWW